MATQRGCVHTCTVHVTNCCITIRQKHNDTQTTASKSSNTQHALITKYCQEPGDDNYEYIHITIVQLGH